MLTKNIKFLNYLKVDKTKLNLQLKKIKKENILPLIGVGAGSSKI